MEKSKNIYQNLNPAYNKSIYTWADIDSGNEEENEKSDIKKLLLTSHSLIDSQNNKKNNKSKEKKFNYNYNIKNIGGYIVRPDLNLGYYHKSVCSNVEFSSFNENLVFTTGLDKKLNLFLINNESTEESEFLNNPNSKVKESKLTQSVITNDMPIYSAKFLQSNEIILSGRRKHYFTYDLEKNKLSRFVFNNSALKTDIKSLEKCYTRYNNGNYAFTTLEGDIFLFDAYSKQFKTSFKINGSVNSIAFSSNTNYLYSCSNQGEIYMFDVRRNNVCVNKIDDDGSFNTLSLDVDINNKYLATSLHSGVVNLYNIEEVNNSTNGKVEPIKVSNEFFN